MSVLFEEIAISPKLELCGANEVDIRNQRPRLRRNRLILVKKSRGVVNQLQCINFKNYGPLVKYLSFIFTLIYNNKNVNTE